MTENYLDILARTIRENWDQPALTDFYLTEDGIAQDTSRGNRYTYGEMYAEICRVADLLTAIGLQEGDHIAICGANSAHWVIAYLAVAKIQGVSVTVMHSLMPDEIANLVAFSDAKALFTDGDIWGEISPLCGSEELCSIGCPVDIHRTKKGVRCVLSLADWSLLDGHSDRAMTERQPREDRDISFPSFASDDLAMICFTSGTSGSAKGVMLSMNSISNNVAYKLDLFSRYVGTNVLAILPFAHIYGLVIELLLPLCAGAITNIIISNSISIKNIISSCIILSPKIIFVVPRLIEYLINENYNLKRLFKGLDFLSVGGAELKNEVEKKMQQNNIGIAIGYGATECGTRITLATAQEYKSGSVGKVVSGLELKIADTGEILVKGENVMLGYYKDPEATAQKIDKDGWLHTGDAGYMDEDGYLYVTGRIGQDMIVLPNGENIHPEDIENKLNALPEVQESIVVAREGHLVAIVRLTDSSQNSPNTPNTPNALKDIRHAILRTINPQLPDYSQLYSIDFIDKPLERTAKQTIKRYLYK